MVEYTKDEVARLSPTNAVIDCNGLRYAVSISLNAHTAIQGKKEYKLYICETICEGACVLYGFIDERERELFLLLVSVSSIGGNMARMILSALSPSELINTISTGNTNLLKMVKSIGLRTAQRVIVGPKDKIKPDGIVAGTTDISAFITTNVQAQEEAVTTLAMLGFAQAPSQKVVMVILKEDTGASVGQVIKLALEGL